VRLWRTPDPTSGMNSSSAGNVNCNCCSHFSSSTSSRVLVLVVRPTAVPGASLAQLFPAACAASPTVQWGSSLRTSLLAGIVRSGALSNNFMTIRVCFGGFCKSSHRQRIILKAQLGAHRSVAEEVCLTLACTL